MDKSKLVEYVEREIVNYDDSLFAGLEVKEEFKLDFEESGGECLVTIFIDATIYAEKGYYTQFYSTYGRAKDFEVAYTDAQVNVDNYLFDEEFFTSLFDNYTEYEADEK